MGFHSSISGNHGAQWVHLSTSCSGVESSGKIHHQSVNHHEKLFMNHVHCYLYSLVYKVVKD